MKFFSCHPAQQNPTCLLHWQLSFSNQHQAVSFSKSKVRTFHSPCNFFLFSTSNWFLRSKQLTFNHHFTLGREGSSDPPLPLPLAVVTLASTSRLITCHPGSTSIHPYLSLPSGLLLTLSMAPRRETLFSLRSPMVPQHKDSACQAASRCGAGPQCKPLPQNTKF